MLCSKLNKRIWTVWFDDFSNSWLNTFTRRVTGLSCVYCKCQVFRQLTAQTCPAIRRGFFRSTEQFYSVTLPATGKTGRNTSSRGKTRITRIHYWTYTINTKIHSTLPEYRSQTHRSYHRAVVKTFYLHLIITHSSWQLSILRNRNRQTAQCVVICCSGIITIVDIALIC